MGSATDPCSGRYRDLHYAQHANFFSIYLVDFAINSKIARQVVSTRPTASMLASQHMGSPSPMHTTAEPRAMASNGGVVPERWPQSRDPYSTGSPCTTAGSAMVRDLCSTPW